LYLPHKDVVYNPLKLIKNILETGNINAIESLKKSDGEFDILKPIEKTAINGSN
jgi:hypothetical protein